MTTHEFITKVMDEAKEIGIRFLEITVYDKHGARITGKVRYDGNKG